MEKMNPQKLIVNPRFSLFDEAGDGRQMVFLQLFRLGDKGELIYLSENPCKPSGPAYLQEVLDIGLPKGKYLLALAKSDPRDPIYGPRTLISFYHEDIERVGHPLRPGPTSAIDIEKLEGPVDFQLPAAAYLLDALDRRLRQR